MKRLVWIFIAIFCTAIAQVQPVELQKAKQDSCGCCEKPGACGMPDCALPTAHNLPTMTGAVASTVVRTMVKEEARSIKQPAEKFYAAFVSAGVRPAVACASDGAARVASVPLFKAHCAFLI